MTWAPRFQAASANASSWPAPFIGAPAFLFLDEGTSHLDPALEERVNAAIGELAITRVIIAHRPQTVAAANRVILLHQGRLIEIKRSDGTAPALAQNSARPLLSQAAVA